MKEISYTYMREHLTEVLEGLRMGEQYLVTQRGKSDLVLSAAASNSAAQTPPAGEWMRVPNPAKELKPVRAGHAGMSKAHQSGYMAGIGKSQTKTRDNFRKTTNSKGLSFSEAKARTQSRHAGIIKILGDK
ncbi:hypothetical protein P9477_22155 [Enterobacter mori]|uniref:hypothetical protein n=1 Tax=Enterobacter mori TaxID=539813 RepID=UPI00398BA421